MLVKLGITLFLPVTRLEGRILFADYLKAETLITMHRFENRDKPRLRENLVRIKLI